MKKSGKLTTIILLLAFLVGLSLLLYPTVADYWNSLHQSNVISTYNSYVAELDESQYDEILESAMKYNESLLSNPNKYLLTDEQKQQYEQLLNVDGSGVMGYIEIPAIGVYLPVLHGTSDATLQVAIGHIEWTSLPVGGESTHCALSGHRGLPSARLFTDLVELIEGDVFLLHVLNETYTYEVDQIHIVDPDDTEDLLAVDGMDYCTLTTCTPYGINTHRVLVRGHRIATEEETVALRITSEISQVEPMIVAPILAIPLILLFLLWVFISGKFQKKKENNSTEDEGSIEL